MKKYFTVCYCDICKKGFLAYKSDMLLIEKEASKSALYVIPNPKPRFFNDDEIYVYDICKECEKELKNSSAKRFVSGKPDAKDLEEKISNLVKQEENIIKDEEE